ncbi:H+ symporter [Colletotrichum paranaense]|uniref:H+ symporter n=3 Tax=Colletotrichum acutatum species complex TaxID=2707335 RepID=A0ABQ9PFY1_9PEZI|nr:H+ symporter [Colletotrichum paranaense]XP_060386580.1 H+ symporter [Colletotrichum tamarilloi]KAK0368805.1 H+ symporter [Colletotrichum limetticola]KAK1507627.1 H+ symporter [Colletotrichum tamarilloi]KAK1544163.1 H+ symporter [Colletotrichum paranaense]
MDEMLPPPMTPSTERIHRRTNGGNKAFHNFANDYSHITDPSLRRRLALSEIDKVPFGLYHVRAILVAGVGFFLDSYDIFAINLITTLLGVVFWQGPPESSAHGYGGNNGELPGPVNSALKASTSAGIIVGQIVFGWLADVFGRRRMYGVELGIIILATLSAALVSPSQSVSFTGLMIFWRVIMGVGIGGDYPLSSVITSEFAPTRWRGAMIAAVFSMQGMGQLGAAVVALVTAEAFKDSYLDVHTLGDCHARCQLAADRSWRIIVGMGAVPACIALYYRITIPETPRYTFDVEQDVEKADADIRAYMASKSKGDYDTDLQFKMKKETGPGYNTPAASWPDAWAYFTQWKHFKMLLGTAFSWFFLDLAFYGLGLNSTVVLQTIGYADGANFYKRLHNQAVGLIILACAGAIPGYWVSVFTIDTLGRKPIQIMGFFMLTVIFCVLGFLLHQLTDAVFLTLYITGQFFFNFGPNTTTFIVPGECFPTRYRSTGHGISAAMGKVGAILAQVISIPLLAKDVPGDCHGDHCAPWLDRLLELFALFMFLGMLSSLLIPETKGMTLEELAGETPTSYNRGRNGSISHYPRPQSKWNPFGGGHPAGFHYPRTSTVKAARVGIMTSPDLLAEEERRRRSQTRFWRKRRRERGGGGSGSSIGGGTDEYPMSIRNSGVSSAYTGRNMGAADEQMPADPAAPGVFPTWGAGWGRVDRGAQPMENVKLHDVGSLLRRDSRA